jgi:predicted P-loop ATPase
LINVAIASGSDVIEVPRQSVLVGGTNSDAYLKDETGGRRFDVAAIKRDRDQRGRGGGAV